ncbi:hypothetical protein ACFWG4_38455 [Rhodococcus wratislaviensis]
MRTPLPRLYAGGVAAILGVFVLGLGFPRPGMSSTAFSRRRVRDQ